MLSASHDIDYSIVICTYNPDVRILQRCLQAVQQLDTSNLQTEVILVDNNSNTPVNNLPCVVACRQQLPAFTCLLVKEQGVRFARMAAIEQAAGKFIVYIDYDNEPEKDYLQQLKQLNTLYPGVAAWGPGNVQVDFIDGVNEAIAAYARVAFQERHEQEVLFSSEKQWQPCYPFGTGLCTYAFLLREYIRMARAGKFTLDGRTGEKLSSGEDTQMILLCISMGYAAGVSPDLHITHMIPASRANDAYLRRLAYGTSVCYATCLLQVFPEQEDRLLQQVMGPYRFLKNALKQFIKVQYSKEPHRLFELARFIGLNTGLYHALNKPVPLPVNKIARYLKLE
ncbi:glycosyltransferase [Deminuibacter soli]|uniref:Glycosyltransferase family 2 protein n=1 Tax=Deminuibacter soli TaxID=2291815 RepID=A0A3E1NIQ3_9BACT|nr:glycosyltransferase [Deminuibacter soli]RFM27813.1 glycosyltransferase family 2 protein [Deminuibacter soli]